MNNDFHQRARILIDQARVAGISQEEESWLKNHTIGCTECRAYAETTARVIQGLGSFSFDIDPGLAARVQKAITLAAETAAVRRFARRRFLAGGMIALLLTFTGSLASWEVGGLVVAHIQIAPWLWKTGVVLWSLPSLCVAFVLIFAWRYLAGNFNEESVA
jgi:hypothetical protein